MREVCVLLCLVVLIEGYVGHRTGGESIADGRDGADCVEEKVSFANRSTSSGVRLCADIIAEQLSNAMVSKFLFICLYLVLGYLSFV